MIKSHHMMLCLRRRWSVDLFIISMMCLMYPLVSTRASVLVVRSLEENLAGKTLHVRRFLAHLFWLW